MSSTHHGNDRCMSQQRHTENIFRHVDVADRPGSFNPISLALGGRQRTKQGGVNNKAVSALSGRAATIWTTGWWMKSHHGSIVMWWQSQSTTWQMFAVPSRGNRPTHVVMHQKTMTKNGACTASVIHPYDHSNNVSISLRVTPKHWSERVKHLRIAISPRIQTPIYSQKKDPKSTCVLYPCKYPMCNLRKIPVLCFRNIFFAGKQST